MNNNTQESKIQLEYINKCTELVKEKYEKVPAFFIQNAGCQMNSLQTETVAGIVKRMGYTEVSREEDADVVIYNTCTVRENANLKIYGHLGHLKSIKKKNPELKIVLFGCMRSWRVCLLTVNIPLRRVSILCLAAIISAVTVLYHM